MATSTFNQEKTLNSKDNKISLKAPGVPNNYFGKACALTSLAATAFFYVGAAELASEVIHDVQKPVITNEWQKNDWNKEAAAYRSNIRWPEEFGALGLSLAAGFSGIALGYRRRKFEKAVSNGAETYKDNGNTYYSPSSDSSWWNGYFLGSMLNSGGSSSGGWSSSSSSSDDNGKALVAIVIVAALGAACVGTGYVTYKSVRANFGPTPV